MRRGEIEQTNDNQSGTPRFGVLQAARAIAALMVVSFHAAALVQSPQYWGATLFGGWADIGASGVAFFFVLSGFLIYRLHRDDIGRPKRLRLYARRRCRRIFPLYWMVTIPLLCIYAASPFFGSGAETKPENAVTAMLLIGPGTPPLAVAWTLLHEVLFYALFAVLIVHRRVGIAALFVWFTISAIGLHAGYAFASINVLFAFGIATAWFLPKIELPNPRTIMLLGIVIFLAAGAASLAITGEHHPVRQPLWVLTLQGTGGAMAIVGAVRSEAQRLITAPTGLIAVGNASYAIYLVHYPLIGAVALALPGLPPLLAFVILSAVGMVGGLVTHTVLERPAMQILRSPKLRFATA